jgi:3-deoxy-D-manno-octulosonic acid kinase
MQFETRTAPSARLVVDPEYADAAVSLGLADAAGLDRRLASASGAGGRAGSALLALPGGLRLHLRPVRHGGWLAPLWGDRLLGLGRPLRELEANAALRERGAPVPRPVLVAGLRRGWLWSAAVGTLHEDDTRDGLAWIDARPTRRALAAVARAAARAVRRFHDAGGRHADLHLGNLLLRERPGGVEVLVIDLDKARVGAAPDAARRMRELMRLYRSLAKRGAADAFGARGCARFLHAYCGGDRALRSALLARLPQERRRLSRHARSWRAPWARSWRAP